MSTGVIFEPKFPSTLWLYWMYLFFIVFHVFDAALKPTCCSTFSYVLTRVLYWQLFWENFPTIYKIMKCILLALLPKYYMMSKMMVLEMVTFHNEYQHVKRIYLQVYNSLIFGYYCLTKLWCWVSLPSCLPSCLTIFVRFANDLDVVYISTNIFWIDVVSTLLVTLLLQFLGYVLTGLFDC